MVAAKLASLRTLLPGIVLIFAAKLCDNPSSRLSEV